VKIGVRGRLIGLSLIFIGVVDFGVGLVLERHLRGRLEDAIDAELHRHGRTLRDIVAVADLHGEPAVIDPVADRLGASMEARVTIIAADGRVLGDSDVATAELALVDNHANRPEIMAALRDGEGTSRRRSSTLGDDLQYVAVRLADGSVARVGLPLRAVDDAVRQQRLVLIAAGVVALLAATLLMVAMWQLMSRDVRAVLAQARRRATRTESGDEPAPGDEFDGLAGSFKAITADLEEALGTLASERNRFEAVVETMDQGVLALDRQNRITMANRAARRLLELPRDVRARPLLELVRAPAMHDLLTAAGEGRGAVAELEHGVAAPRRLRVQANGQPGGGAVVVVQDVTEIRRLETVRRDFVANVSHELRTPIAVIRANAETLASGGLDRPERARVFVEALHRHAERLGALVSDLLDISRIEAGRWEIAPKEVALAAIGRRVVEALSTAAAERQIGLDLHVHEDLQAVADDAALEQVLVNLVSNAIKYTQSGGRVEIGAARLTDGSVRMEVRDDGPGIDPKHGDRIFERFYRVDPGRSRAMGGTGLGLAIVRNLVEAMGGEVGVDPRRPRGSIFWFTLPGLEDAS
jgi:two-component system, OmpR family, phosphate regulon sensor histidine kinase PhoR